ncbi:MAG: DUF4352 domain-containing protein [Lachnobacterium sp.]|nr:DUF4352 domain-containing protein [Lachnobacterium sp.]
MENETKLCKHCKTPIPKDAKVCPNCRKKQGGVGKWIIIGVIVVILLAALFGGGDDKPKKVENSKVESTQQDEKKSEEPKTDVNTEEVKDIFEVGETAELNDVQVTLLSYKESKGSEYNKPSDGNVFLMAEFEIVNNSDSEMNVSSVMSFEAYADDYSLNYSFGALMDNEDRQMDGTIAAGKKMKGYIGYEVPKDWSTVEIHFTDDVWSNNKFKFEIKK